MLISMARLYKNPSTFSKPNKRAHCPNGIECPGGAIPYLPMDRMLVLICVAVGLMPAITSSSAFPWHRRQHCSHGVEWIIETPTNNLASCSTCRSEEHTSELQSRGHLVCRLLLEKKKLTKKNYTSRIITY